MKAVINLIFDLFYEDNTTRVSITKFWYNWMMLLILISFAQDIYHQCVSKDIILTVGGLVVASRGWSKHTERKRRKNVPKPPK